MNQIKNDTSSQQMQTEVKLKPIYKFEKCIVCKKRSKPFEENNKLCRTCYYKANTIYNPSGNKIIDDFIKYIHTFDSNVRDRMEFVPYEQFKNIEFIGEGGFSKVYKATWIDGTIKSWDYKEHKYNRNPNQIIALKKLNNSKNFTSKELNELKISYKFKVNRNIINEYYGITQDPNTKEFAIIMEFCNTGDLSHDIAKDFFNVSWDKKLSNLYRIALGLSKIHKKSIIHRDLHSGNILINNNYIKIGDLGLSKSATEAEDNETYGIIPYIAPEVLQGKKYTIASDIYSFGMIMWECMTGRRPFWDRTHDTELIIDICDGLRPLTGIVAPEGYIELMKECWDPDQSKRPASGISSRIWNMYESERRNPTGIVESSEIGPVTTNNPGAFYKSRSLSKLINSAVSTRRLRSQSFSSDFGKRKFEGDIFESNADKGNKKIKLENEPYTSKALEYNI